MVPEEPQGSESRKQQCWQKDYFIIKSKFALLTDLRSPMKDYSPVQFGLQISIFAFLYIKIAQCDKRSIVSIKGAHVRYPKKFPSCYRGSEMITSTSRTSTTNCTVALLVRPAWPHIDDDSLCSVPHSLSPFNALKSMPIQ